MDWSVDGQTGPAETHRGISSLGLCQRPRSLDALGMTRSGTREAEPACLGVLVVLNRRLGDDGQVELCVEGHSVDFQLLTVTAQGSTMQCIQLYLLKECLEAPENMTVFMKVR